MPPPQRLAALLHDAAEAYLGDMVKQLKNLFPEFSAIEALVMQIIGQRFNVDLAHLDPAIKAADLIALATEKRDLMPHSTEAWANLRDVRPLPENIRPLSPPAAKSAFLDSFHQLRG